MQTPPSLQPLPTKDGFQTLYSERFDATYHSHNGAFQETKTVFIEAGLQYVLANRPTSPENPLRVLDIGFGTGLNALMSLTYAQSLQPAPSIFYTGAEAYPIPIETAQTLNYPQALSTDPSVADFFVQMHQLAQPLAPEAPKTGLTEQIQLGGFRFGLWLERFEHIAQTPTEHEGFGLVYYDAFAPNTQPELWTPEQFAGIYARMRAGGVLVTYCAKGAVKRALKSAGFLVESLPGPVGKREMTRAVKPKP